MSEIFIPEMRNPPAKVKDAGLVNLAMAGAGVYNAKNSEIIFLPSGRNAECRLAYKLTDALFGVLDIQNVDCSGSEQAVYSLAERYVREYGKKALSWMEVSGRNLNLYGWAESEEAAIAAVNKAACLIKDTISPFLPPFSFLPEIHAGKIAVFNGVCETGKGAFHSTAGLKCSGCGSFFTPDSANLREEPPVNECMPEEPLIDVYTPAAHTIPLLCEYLGLENKNTLKAMLYTVEMPNNKKELLFAMIRGDRNISINKLSAFVESKFQKASFRRADPDEITSAFGEVAGFCGPVGVPDNVYMVADLTLKGGKNFVVGGNRPDYHRKGCCWKRDFEPPVADLMLYEESVPCSECGCELKETELRSLCSFECYDSEAAGENVLSCRDRDGQHSWPYRWRGRVSFESILLAVFENGNIDNLVNP